LILLVCVVAALASIPARVPHEVRFQNWMQKHGREYATQDEYELRLGHFVTATSKVAELNARALALNSTATYALNKFADLSAAEFSQYLGMQGYKPQPRIAGIEDLETPATAAPAKFDWRSSNTVTAVKDQGQCGSCWAFAVTENVESVWVIAKGQNAGQIPPLSPQQIVDCDTANGGCSGGDPATAFKYVVSRGLEPASAYPYHAKDETCKYQAGQVYARISSFKYAGKNEATMAANLAAWAPLVIIVDASQWQYYSGGVLKASECGHDLDHAVLAVGYDTQAGYWSVRNSWGADWGESGYLRIQYNANTCGLTLDEATCGVA